MIGSNVFGQAQQYQTQAGDTYGRLSNFTPTDVSGVGQVNVGTLAGMDYGAYMSPYQQQVIDRGQADIERQRQLASNTLGAQASRANAFGGSRQAVQEGVLAGEALRQAADLSAQQRQRGFETALQSGRYDISNQIAAQEAAAAREQAANMANYQGQFQAANIQAGAAGGLRGLGSTMFGQGMDAIQQQQQAAARAQAQQQAMLDAARMQTMMNLGYPGQALQTGTGVLSQLPSSRMTTSGSPGLFDILTGVGSIF